MSVATVRTVSDYMSHDPVTIDRRCDTEMAIGLLARHHVCALPVTDSSGRLVGILSERDCLDAFLHTEYHELPPARVGDLMTSNVTCVDPETDILRAAELFSEKKFHHLPVLDRDRLVGQISRKDVIRAIQEMRHAN